MEEKKEVLAETEKQVKEDVKVLAKQDAKEGKKTTKKKEEKETSGNIFKTVFNIIFWVALIGLAAIWLTEFILVRNEKEPMFCLEEKTHEFTDGTVTECIGLGYKVFDYNRTSINATEFGPFFIEMQE